MNASTEINILGMLKLQFFKVGIKQNYVSTVIWLIKVLAINARDPRHWEEVAFVYITKNVFSLKSNHIFVHFNHYA